MFIYVENIVPVSILRERESNFLDENELYNKKNNEKLGFLKYSTRMKKIQDTLRVRCKS